MKKVLLKIDGMTCSACSNGLEKYLNKQEGIKQASVNLVMNHASIEYDETLLDIPKIERFIEKAGFESLGIDKLEKEKKKASNEKYILIGLTILAILILYISMGQMVGLPIFKILNMHQHPINFSIVQLVLSVVAIFLGKDILKNGYKNLIHKTPNMDTLVGLGVISSLLYSMYNTYLICIGNEEAVHHLYYESIVIILFFIKIGKYVEGRNKDKTKEAIQDLMMITPNLATIEKDGKQKQVTLDEIQKGDRVICKPGEKIAVDGEIVEGMTHIDEAFITGESVPVKKTIGDKVIAGSINYDGVITYKAEKIGKESTVSEIVRMVVEATNTKAPIAKIADKISGYFVPAIILIAIFSGIIWLILGKDIGFAINIFITVLVVACPCSLGLATPLAIVMASGLASRKGILIKSSESLENAHKIKTIVFDKTGTLTKGHLSISQIFNYSDLKENEIIEAVANIEHHSEHPIARGIVKYAEERNISIDTKAVTDFKNISGYGIEAKYHGENYVIGNKKIMQKNNISLDKSIKENEIDDDEALENDGNSIIFVAKEHTLIALIGVKDMIKENAKIVIDKLKEQNIDTVMLTGDNKKTAKAIGKMIGIEKVIAGVVPKQKAEEITKLKENGLVMMCGDGINDSISLVKADIGVSVGSGTDIAMDSSDVVLMKDNLDKINDLINISKKTMRIIKQNLFWAFFYNICMIPIAAGILIPLGITMNPMFAAFSMTISSVTVTLNSLRLKNI